MENFNFSFPVKKPCVVSRNFGLNHDGIDIAGEGYNTPVVAVGDGLVFRTFYDNTYGNQVIIKHNNNMYSVYSHLNKIDAIQDSMIKKNEKIGTIGSTGMTTTVHLHFSIWIGEPYNGGIPNNPLNYIN